MCGQLLFFPERFKSKKEYPEMDKLTESFNAMLKEAREFHDVMDSLPLKNKKPVVKTDGELES
jgi:hypothetical protein